MAENCADVIEDEIKAMAKANQKASGENFGKGTQKSAEPIKQNFVANLQSLGSLSTQKSAEPIKQTETRKELAKLAGVSHDIQLKRL